MSSAVAQKQGDLAGGLFETLVAEGFSGYCFGPKGDPYAVIAFYEWDNHIDVVTVLREGPVAAARLAKPADVLKPPDTGVWSWVGEAHLAIGALVNLPHPDHPDAPDTVVETPAAVRVPEEHQRRPMYVRVPDAGKADARAARLSGQPRQAKISEQYFNDLFDEVDSRGAIAAALNFTEDATFVFGNMDPLVGRAAIAQFTMQLYTMVSTVSHELHNYWRVGEQYAFTNGRVTFTLRDDTKLTAPFATVSHFIPDGTLMTYHQVYGEMVPLLMQQFQQQ